MHYRWPQREQCGAGDVGYGVALGRDPVSQPIEMLALRDIPQSFIAVGLFVVVVVASLDIVRHRLRLTEVVREAPGVVSITVSGRRLEKLRAPAVLGSMMPSG